MENPPASLYGSLVQRNQFSLNNQKPIGTTAQPWLIQGFPKRDKKDSKIPKKLTHQVFPPLKKVGYLLMKQHSFVTFM